MADVRNWPWLLNQEGLQYPAEIVRGQHYDATSGGNGVGSPRALKVVPQTAPDGTVRVLPGGGTAVSPWAENQSYYALNHQPATLEVPPTGSASGGRTDLIVQRFADPQYGVFPPGTTEADLTPETVKLLDFWWFEILQGVTQDATLDYPHVKLAALKRPANTTIVSASHLTDLRELANPKTSLHMRANNMITPETQSLHSGSTIWPRDATHTMRIPEFATQVHIWGNWALVRAAATGQSQGTVVIALVHPDGSEVKTQISRWRNVRTSGTGSETLNIMLGDNRPVPAKFRGQTVTVEMRGTKTSGPNVYMDGNSSWSVQLYFEQEIA